MTRIKSRFRYNPDLPGSIENVHPNKFIANLRPVDEFRHTPIVPISEKDLKEHRKKIEEMNRKGYYFEIKKDTLYYYGVALIGVVIFVYVFMLTNEKELAIKYDIDKTRISKAHKYYQPTRGLIGEHKEANMKPPF